ncbi:hypothetical protein FXO37_30208 [Capsicum annuum]|nr:hypothetical protein FXO37_30208 [Capsicum annuum]
MIPAYHPLQPFEKDDKDMGYVEPAEIEAIIPPPLPPNVKFDITSAMIEPLNFKGVFLRASTDDANLYLANYTRICTTYTITGLKKKQEEGKYQKFLSMLKELSINIPLVEALEKMPRYAKFMKYLITKKNSASYGPVPNIHHCGVVVSRSLVEKKEDPDTFTISCTIGSFNFTKALWDLGASIKLIPFTIFKYLGLGTPKPTTMRLVMVDKIVKKLVGILYDVLLKHDGSDVIVPIEEISGIEALAAVIINFDSDGIEEYEEMVCSIQVNSYYSYAPKNLDLDLKNRTTLPTRPCIDEPPVLELKALPSHLRYPFLGANNTLHIIIAADLIHPEEVVKKEIIKWLDACAVGVIPPNNTSSSKQAVKKSNKKAQSASPEATSLEYSLLSTRSGDLYNGKTMGKTVQKWKYGFDWMTRAPGKYGKVLVQEFYAEYNGELQRQNPQVQLWKDGDPITSLTIQGAQMDISPRTID